MNTRFLYAYPLKNKKASSIVEALTHFLDRNEPTSISFDAGTEFVNKDVA